MHARLLFLILGLASCQAQAQQVELIIAAPSAEIGSLPPEQAFAFVDQAALGTTRSSLSTRPSPTLPRWLSGHAAREIGRLPSTGCGNIDFRSRRDLSPASQLRRARFYALVAQAACEAGVPVGLFDALVHQESRYNPAALSPKGALGLAQLMPGTARMLGVDPYDPVDNLRGGARYLRQQLDSFGRVDLALAAYNAGPARVRRSGAVPRIRETTDYVSSILRRWGGDGRTLDALAR